MSRRLDADFLARYRPADIPGLPKYAQLREALQAAIDDGYWTPGSRVPNEAMLASMTPYSLGTVQKALRDLVQSGAVVRRRGEGSFVAERRTAMNSPLHVRFEDEAGRPLAVYPRIVAREPDGSSGPWREFFKNERADLLRIDRIFLVGKRFNVFSSIYLNSARFPIFTSRPASKLQSSNFKQVMHREYNVLVQRVEQCLRTEKFSRAVCDVLTVPKDTVGSKLELCATDSGGRPAYYQEAFVPPNPCRLRLSDWMPGL